MLGLIACIYYLTATYRRSPRFRELALPLIPGLPLLVIGGLGVGRPPTGFSGRDGRSAASPALRCSQPLDRRRRPVLRCFAGVAWPGRSITLAGGSSAMAGRGAESE